MGPVAIPADTPIEVRPEIHAIAFSKDGSVLFSAVGAKLCRVEALDMETRGTKTWIELAFCPDRLATFDDGSVLATNGETSAWIDADASIRFEGRRILAANDTSHFIERTESNVVMRSGDESSALEAAGVRDLRLTSDGIVLGIESGTNGERIVAIRREGRQGVTHEFEAIDSWDIAPRGDELTFSARVNGGYDIGIVSVSGGEINWVAPDPADERNVTWAPRGSKITYTIESVDATLIRSVHVPTSFQLVFELPLTRVKTIAWEPQAERFALVIDSPGVGPRIDWIRYNGEGRESLVDARERVDCNVESVLWDGGSGVLLGPDDVRYGEAKPTVLWIDREEPFAWRAEVARLRGEGIPVLVTSPERLGHVVSAFSDLPWVRAPLLYVVDVTGSAVSEGTELKFATLFTRGERSKNAGGDVELIHGDDVGFEAQAANRILERVTTR